MVDIRITAGSFGVGSGSYETGVLHMPDGAFIGVETLESLDASGGSDADPHWSGDLVRGLKGALVSTGSALPRPFGLAASVMGIGLDAFGPAGRPPARLRAIFRDGATAEIEADHATAAAIAHDREVVRLAGLRRDATALPAPPEPGADPVALPGDRAGPGPTLTSMFEYEKRKGRVRRVAKVPSET